MGRRLVAGTDSLVLYSTFGLGELYPLNAVGAAIPQPLSHRWFSKIAGGFGRKPGIDVKGRSWPTPRMLFLIFVISGEQLFLNVADDSAETLSVLGNQPYRNHT